jgi:radical SAM-linked protein
MVSDKVRIRFRKGGDLRWVSHHDLMRCFERMLRRANLPYHVTQGFHPKPRLVFALALPLGVIGCEEVVELELDENLPLEEIESRLVSQAPPGIEILSIVRIDTKVTAHVRRMCYRVALPPDQDFIAIKNAVTSAEERGEILVDRQKPTVRTVNIRPYIRSLLVEEGVLKMDLWVTPNGTAKPEEILRLLGLESLTANGAVLERSQLELHEEIEAPSETVLDSENGPCPLSADASQTIEIV